MASAARHRFGCVAYDVRAIQSGVALRLPPHSKIWNFLNFLGELTVTRHEING